LRSVPRPASPTYRLSASMATALRGRTRWSPTLRSGTNCCCCESSASMAPGPPTPNATRPAAISAIRATTRWPRRSAATPICRRARGHLPGPAARLEEGRGGHGRGCQRQYRLPRPRRDRAFFQPRDLSGHSRITEEAKATLLQSLQKKPNWVPTYRFLASCYAHMGRLDEAREAVLRLRSLTNVVVPSAANWRNPEHRELYLSGLRLAAGEAT
jgi:hypothetical protein